ncbi:MAG: Crp/Fnr family transcriptional regulator [Saprospiraceae bacterium]|nr:Crp/Fnr family transcriptional regulator [Saprospiraceae bacterium]
MDNFFKAIARFANLSGEAKRDLGDQLRRLEFPKGHILLHQDKICNHLYFVHSGLVRTYYLKEGKDVTDWFSFENSFACSPISLINRQTDRRALELLEHSILLSIHYDSIESLCQKHHNIETFFRRLVNFSLVQMLQKLDALHFTTALQRYKTLMETNPTIIHRVPLGMIASYLGITQETLSRIRAQV